MKPLTQFHYFLQLCTVLVLVTRIVLIVDAIEEAQKKKVGLITGSLPWVFGPYQSQMHELSLLLSQTSDNDSQVEYEVYWLCHTVRIPEGVYKTYEELKPHIPTFTKPPSNFPLNHITFVGHASSEMSAKRINELSQMYGLDAVILLVDITITIPNEPLNVPVIAWVPLHSEHVKRTTVDYWALRQYHGIAGLAPSGVNAIQSSIKTEITLSKYLAEVTSNAFKKMTGISEVEFIPHIIDRFKIDASADVGLKLLKDYSVAQADSKLTQKPLINRGQEKTLEAGHDWSIFNNRENDFIILLQGGNYDKEDRKGWYTSLQAFAKFYNSLQDPSNVHLLIHSMEFYLIASDQHLDQDAPAEVMPIGNMIHYTLYDYGLPRDSYTIDIAKHAPEIVAAYKKRASVCLHPSKVEGFGMNVLECQAVGTPVITTNYTAMGDFTKLGISVPYRQKIRVPGCQYEMALPDVQGITEALTEMYEKHMAIVNQDAAAMSKRQADIQNTHDWMDKTFSPSVVADKFRSLLLRSNIEFHSRLVGKQQLLSHNPPTMGAFEIAAGYHTPIIDWDTPWTLLAPEGVELVNAPAIHQTCWQALLGKDSAGTPVMVLPARYEDGSMVPLFNENGGIHEDVTVLVRTYILSSLQLSMSRRKSLIMTALNLAQIPKSVNNGGAVIKRKRDGDDGEWNLEL